MFMASMLSCNKAISSDLLVVVSPRGRDFSDPVTFATLSIVQVPRVWTKSLPRENNFFSGLPPFFFGSISFLKCNAPDPYKFDSGTFGFHLLTGNEKSQIQEKQLYIKKLLAMGSCL